MKKTVAVVLAAVLLVCGLSGCASPEKQPEKIQIQALLLPKFEVGELSGDFPGEAQCYYEAYCAGGEAFDIVGGCGDNKLYVKNGVALYVTGTGKVNAALSTSALLADDRFDFSEAYVISTGCAGAAYGYGVMGDVYVITAAVDYDLGHRIDSQDMAEQSDREATWYHDAEYDAAAYKLLNPALTQKLYDMVKDVPLATTERTRKAMASAFPGEEWAVRDPRVLKGTSVTSDTYWKGLHGHRNAVFVAQTYGCPDPFAASEMEDIGIAVALERAHMLDRYIILRDAVNMDVFMNGDTPDSLWDPAYIESIASADNAEAVDIFSTAMENNFRVGKIIVDAILNKTI